MQVNVDSVQVHPVPVIAVAVKPVGNVSVTVTVPLVTALPLFVAVIVYVAPFCPCVKLPLCDLVMVRSGTLGGLMVVGSEAESLPVLASPPPATVAVLVTLAGALAATFTVSVMAGKLAPGAAVVLVLQASVDTVQLHPVPVIAVAVKPVGSVSVTVTVPEVGANPPFHAVSV